MKRALDWSVVGVAVAVGLFGAACNQTDLPADTGGTIRQAVTASPPSVCQAARDEGDHGDHGDAADTRPDALEGPDPTLQLIQRMEDGRTAIGQLPASDFHGDCAKHLVHAIAELESQLCKHRFDHALDSFDHELAPLYDARLLPAPKPGGKGPVPKSPGPGPVGPLCVTDAAAQSQLESTFDPVRAELLTSNSGDAMVTPKHGGSIQLSDGTRLDIPPGAVSSPTTVVVSSFRTSANLDTDAPSVVVIQPSMWLAVPARLKVPTVLPAGADSNMVRMQSAGPEVSPELAGNEGNFSENLQIVAHGTNGSSATALLPHFSSVLSFFWHRTYLAAQLPARFLSPGDVVFTLEKEGWAPGHVGLYEKAGDVDDPQLPVLGNASVLHATPHDPDPWFDPIFAQLNLPDALRVAVGSFGVREDSLQAGFGAFYLGARRPLIYPDSALDSATRSTIVGFAGSQVGQHYTPFFIDPAVILDLIARYYGTNVDYRAYSCTGLVADAYGGATRPFAVGAFELFGVLLPWEMYAQTRAVDSLSLGAGEVAQVPMVANVYTDSSGGYEADPAGTNMTVGGAAYASLNGNTLALAPQSSDECTTSDVVITAAPPGVSSVSTTLHVTVHGIHVDSQVPANGITVSDKRQAVSANVASAPNCPENLTAVKLEVLGVAGTCTGCFDSSSPSPGTSDQVSFVPSQDLTSGQTYTAKVTATSASHAHVVKTWTFTVKAVAQYCSAWTDLGTVTETNPCNGGQIAIQYWGWMRQRTDPTFNDFGTKVTIYAGDPGLGFNGPKSVVISPAASLSFVANSTYCYNIPLGCGNQPITRMCYADGFWPGQILGGVGVSFGNVLYTPAGSGSVPSCL